MDPFIPGVQASAPATMKRRRVHRITSVVGGGSLGVVLAASACSSFGAGTEPVVEAGRADSDSSPGAVLADASSLEDAARAWRYVFVSSEARDGTMTTTGQAGARAAADAWCKLLADKASAAPHGASWVAWLSVANANAKRRITDGGALPFEYRLVNGTVVFPAGFVFDVTTPPASALQVDEMGANQGALNVWTGTDSAGNASAYTCFDWTSGSDAGDAYGTIGTSTIPTSWTVNGAMHQRCSVSAHVYCFEAP
jgi:hypothetical protein